MIEWELLGYNSIDDFYDDNNRYDLYIGTVQLFACGNGKYGSLWQSCSHPQYDNGKPVVNDNTYYAARSIINDLNDDKLEFNDAIKELKRLW